jgi:hypothetical protein
MKINRKNFQFSFYDNMISELKKDSSRTLKNMSNKWYNYKKHRCQLKQTYTHITTSSTINYGNEIRIFNKMLFHKLETYKCIPLPFK